MGQTEEGADSRKQNEGREKIFWGDLSSLFPLGYGMEKQWLF